MILGLQAGGRAGGSSGVRGALPAVGVTVPPHSRARADLRVLSGLWVPCGTLHPVGSAVGALPLSKEPLKTRTVMCDGSTPVPAVRAGGPREEGNAVVTLPFSFVWKAPPPFFKLLNVRVQHS